jgi:hypothetical protein
MRFINENPRIERRKEVETSQLSELCSKSTSHAIQSDYHTEHQSENARLQISVARSLTSINYHDSFTPFLVMKLRNGRKGNDTRL